MREMADYGHPLTTKQLKLKVALLTQERPTPFTNGIPGYSWLMWFHNRHPNLTVRQSQRLEFSGAKDLNIEKVAIFYKNLQELYDKHEYPSIHIWNYDESGA